MSDDKPIYMAYLLRLWEENDRNEGDGYIRAPVWRASLEDVTTRKRYGFESLKDLFEFLERRMVSASQEHDAEQKPSLPD